MKRTILSAILVLPLLFASCAKDTTDDDPGRGKTQRLSFAISGTNGTVTTYADVTVPGNGFEKKISDISVYLFDYTNNGNGLLRTVADFPSPSLNASGKIVLDMDVDVALTGEYKAYFIANNGDSRFVDMANPYGDGIAVAVGVTTEQMFKNMPAKAFTDVPTDRFLITGATDTPIRAYGTHEATLRNRVARFDLVNLHPSLTITKVVLKDATDRNTVFGDATEDCHPQPVAHTEYNKLDERTWTVYTEDNEVLGTKLESLFFLHPTTIPTHTKLYIEGYKGTQGVDAESFVYEVVGDPVPVQANFRYIVTVDNKLRWTITTADWDTEPTTVESAIPFHVAADSRGTTSLHNTTLTMIYKGSQRMQFITSNPAGVTWEFIPVSGDANFVDYATDKWNVSQSVTPNRTYATTYYSAILTFISNPVTPPDDKRFVSIMRVSDGSQAIDILIYCRPTSGIEEPYYPGSTLKPVTVGGVTWAPANAGTPYTDKPGVYVQWNRRIGYRGGQSTGIAAGPLPFTAFEHPNPDYWAVFELYYQPFIINRSDADGDWLTAGDPDTALRDIFWTYNNLTNPCPVGWGVPTAAQFQSLIDTYSAGRFTTDGTSIIFEGDNAGEYLTLPYTGYLDHTDGKLYNNGTLGRYWSLDADGTQSKALTIGSSGVELDAYPRAAGMQLRCVKQ